MPPQTPSQQNTVIRMRSRSTSTSPNILIADDQSAVREALRLLLKNDGYQTTLGKRARRYVCPGSGDTAAALPAAYQVTSNP